ncbi:MAG: hypothetical protein EOM80_05180 [Erysipelotrichia bacterium]|nr:hypothetical protein [Erysipelotrichia bacterium]
MKFRVSLLVFLLTILTCYTATSDEINIRALQNVQQSTQQNIDQSFNQTVDAPLANEEITNSSENPDFIKTRQAQPASGIGTIKTLVPYEDLYKVLQQDIGKYFILPIDEFEALKKAKESWLASTTTPIADPPPLLYQVNSARFFGRLEENFAFIDGHFNIETFTDAWHEIPIFWGNLAVESVKLNGKPTTLKTSWYAANTRQVNFGKMSRQNMFQNVFQVSTAAGDTLSQNNWKDTMFVLPIKGKGKHECQISFVVPVQNNDDLFTMQFNMARIPLAFMQLKASDFVLSVDSTTFKDFSVAEKQPGEKGCEFIGWLGANSDLSIKWRRKFARATTPELPATTDQQFPSSASETAEITRETANEPQIFAQPLVYSRSHTLVSLGETSIQVFKTIDYTISKAPVSSFSFSIPDKAEIVYVNADRPHTYRMVREGASRRLRVDFMAGREDICQIEISYEAPVDSTSTLIGIPEVTPLNVEREQGTTAVEALTSVEVQPGNTEQNPLNQGSYPLDPLEIPQPLKDKATRPLLLAYRHNISPTNIMLSVKRYLDVPQQTVVADSMEVKTTFTTNKSSNSLVSLNIRNNNKQYLQLQLASGTEVISAFRNGMSVKLVAGKSDGKVQIPLEMSQTVGEPVEMNLQIILKEPVDEIRWRGKLNFEPPLVDIPVSRFSWYIYAPEDYHLYDFSGTVKDTSPRKDPFFFSGFMRLLRFVWSIINSPDLILIIFFIGFIVLMALSRKLLFAILSALWNLISGIFSFIFGGKGFRLVELMIVIGIIGVLAAMAIPNFRKAREQARDKACYANQRVLLGAVEMYNMDNQQQMESLNIDALLNGKYLKYRPSLPERGCRYLSRGNLAQNGMIYCHIHGAVEDDFSKDERASAIQMSRQAVETKSKRLDAMSDMQGISKEAQEPSVNAPSRPVGFGAPRTRGMLPIKTKFVMTKNFYALERDLVIADIASTGQLLANSTCPEIKLSYVWSSVLKSAEVLAFILALFGGLYFVSGAFLAYSNKITFAAIIIILLSVIDIKLKSIGESANAGLWFALIGAFIWKSIWLISKIKLPETSEDPLADLKKPSDISGKSGLAVLLTIAAVITAIFSLPLSAADYREIRVMAPFKELSKVVPTGDRVVIIPEDDYKYLKDIVAPQIPEIMAPQQYRFESVKYSGTIENYGVRFSGDFKLDLFNAGWKKVSLLSTEAIPSAATMNGVTLPMTLVEDNGTTSYGFLTNATGSVSLRVEFFVPMASSEYRHTSRFTLNTVPVCLSTLEITVNEKDCEAWIDPGVLRPAERMADKTIFKALLPPTSLVNFELYRNVPVSQPDVKSADKPETQADQPITIEEKTRITVRQHNLLYFKEGFVSGTNTYDLKIKGGSGIASLSFHIPPKIRILNVDNKLIEKWKQTEENSERHLEITFKSRIRGNTNLTIDFEEDIQNLKNENYNVPEIYPIDAEQSFGILGIGCLQTLEISVSAIPQGFSPIIAAEFLKDWAKERPEKTPYAFKFLRHPNTLSLTISRPEDIDQQTAVIDRAEAMTLLNEDGYLLTRVVYEVRNNSQQFLKVKLPQIETATTELWSTQVAGFSVRAGFDEEYDVYNLPIVRSQIENGESRSFPVEIVYAVKTGKQLTAYNQTHIELPTTHLPISELSWMLYLPEGYELMRETGNVDRRQTMAETKFINKSSYFGSMSSYAVSQKRQTVVSQIQTKQTERVFGTAGLLPVKFKIPTTSWATSFTMLQIEPSGKAPYIEGMLVNPRKGRGFLFQMIMIIVGIIAAAGLIGIFISSKKYLWFIITAIQGIILAIAVYLKLYQADHFVQLGFSTTFFLWLLYHFFAWKPEQTEGQVKK